MTWSNILKILKNPHKETIKANKMSSAGLKDTRSIYKNQLDFYQWAANPKIKLKNSSIYNGGLVTKLCPTLMIPWIMARQAPLSMGFFRKEYWSGLAEN